MGGTGAADAGRRFRLASPASALVLGVLVLALMIADVPLASLAHQSLAASGGSLPVWILAPICWLASLAGQALSFRRSSGERRQQLKWLMTVSAVGLAGIGTSFLFSSGMGGAFGQAGIVAIPLGIGVAVLRYRLFDIDRIISRTLAYAIVTGLLVGVYAGLVLLAGRVVSITAPVAVAASTLAAAALFNPLRRRVQRVVDRRFNRARYDAGRTVAAFAARLQDTVDLDSVRDDLAGVVQQALEPAHVSVWLSQRW